MAKSTKSSVTITMGIIVAFFALLSFLMHLSYLTDPHLAPDFLTFSFMIGSMAGVIFGIGVVMFAGWARIGVIIVAAYSFILYIIGILLDLNTFLKYLFEFDPSVVFTGIIFLYLGLIIHYFFRPKVKDQFK